MPILPQVIHRFEIPIDDHHHHLDLTGSILYAACRRRGFVEVWAYARPDSMKSMDRWFIIVGTDHPNPPGTTHAATAITPYGTLVWHVLEQHGTRVEAPTPH